MTTVQVISQTQVIEAPIVIQEITVDPITSEITLVTSDDNPIAVINAGPQGPRGVQGPAGADSAFFNYTQVTPSNSWVINHNMGFYPNVTTFDDTGRLFEANEIHHSVNQLEIQLLTPRAGTARLS